MHKIAFIGQKGIPALSGGVERHVEELAIRLAQRGNEVVVYARKSYNRNQKKYHKGVRIVSIPCVPTKNLDAITYTFFATLHALFQPYDIIHYQSIGPSSLLWLARIFKRNSVIISTFHSQDYKHKKWGIFARFYLHVGEWMACHAPHATITISKSLKHYAGSHHNCNATYIPNGAQVYPVESTNALSKWGLRKDRYLLSLGRLVKHKGIHFLIEAFKNLEDTNKLPNNFKLVIVGESSKTDDYVQYLKFISKGRDNIIFTGEQTGRAAHELFSHAYLFVQPSLSEGLSIALLEAMAYGIAPLVSDIPENLEAIDTAGFTFTAGNKQALTEKLAYLLNKPQQVKNVAEKAKRRAVQEYHWDAIATKTLELYENTLHEKNARSYSIRPKNA